MVNITRRHEPGLELRAAREDWSIVETMSWRRAGPSRGYAVNVSGIALWESVNRLRTLYSSFFSTIGALGCGAGDSLYVPRGPDALPRYVRTSPFVNIPRTPVPFIDCGSLTPNSWSRRYTEGNSGLEWNKGVDGYNCEGRDGTAISAGVGGSGGGGEEEVAACLGVRFSSFGGWRFEMSSPSSARSAMIFPTGTFLAPSCNYLYCKS